MSGLRYSFPPSFDENVASLSVRGKTNDPSDKFTLSISSSFGQCQIRISQGNDCIDAQMRVYKANLSLDYINSQPSRIIYSSQFYDVWKIKENVQLGTKRASDIDGRVSVYAAANSPDGGSEGKLGIGVKAEFGGGASAGRSFQQSVAANRDHSVIKILSPNTIDISYPKHFGMPLEGQFLGEDDILDVIPINKSESYGVVVRLLVREPWITFSDISVVGTSRFARNLSALIGVGATSDSRKMFQRLLAHLVVAKLQTEQDTVNACLAMRGAFFDVERDLTVHSFSRSPTPGLMIINSNILQQFIGGDDVDRERILSGISFDKHFLTAMDTTAPTTNTRLNDISSGVSRVHSWSDLFAIPGNKAETKEWATIYTQSNPKFALDDENPFLPYLYSLARYPLIPEEHWINICTYTKYKYDNFSLDELFFRNGYRSVLARDPDLLQIDSSRVINFSDPSKDSSMLYNSGSWIVGDIALTEQNFSEDEDSLFQYAVCLDSAREIISRFQPTIISDAIAKFASDDRVQDLNKLVALFAVLQDDARDQDVLKALGIINSNAAPSSQLGMLNFIKHRNKDADISVLHAKRQKDLIDLTKLWIEKMSIYHEGMRHSDEHDAESFYLGVREAMKSMP